MTAYGKIHDRTELVDWLDQGGETDYIFFWGHRQRTKDTIDQSCLSQWWPSPFSVEGVRYATAEHFMMAAKAQKFDDRDALSQILSTDDPKQAKRIGRTVQRFDAEVWRDAVFDIVVQGNLAKFSQHESLAAYLLSTRRAVLVEASPVDTIWGIGMSRRNPDARNPRLWRGANKLGFALMEVRRRLADATN